jgi:NAD(P)H-hydrate epimerase
MGQMPLISSDDIIIDAIFGSGLGRPVTGLTRDVINEINRSDALKVSVDVPSGLFCENNAGNDNESIIKADFTLTFQFPKLSFLFPENMKYVGIWKVLPIGLHESAITNTHTPFRLLSGEDILPLLKTRNKFDHKGVFGHGLLISGSYGKIGAAVLGARAALRTGIGLITVHLPSCGNDIMQSSVTEAMVQPDENEKVVSSIPGTDGYSSVGAGPGIGTGSETQAALKTLLHVCRRPMVLDADALNILSMNKEWLELLHPGTILTPHPKEFERLAGKATDSYDRLQKQREFSGRYKCIVILKGAHSSVSFPDGSVYFNNTGNPGMATAGSGDVLTGMVLSLLSQGYSSENAAMIGVYLHGLAGDIAAGESSFESLTASDIINCIGQAFNRIRGY